MNRTQTITLIILTVLSVLTFSGVENFTFGLMDNAPMLALMLLGLDPDGWLGQKLERYNIDPMYLACGVAMFVNTATDGIAGLCDPSAAFVGVVIGCLVPITFLPVIWKLRTREQTQQAGVLSLADDVISSLGELSAETVCTVVDGVEEYQHRADLRWLRKITAEECTELDIEIQACLDELETLDPSTADYAWQVQYLNSLRDCREQGLTGSY